MTLHALGPLELDSPDGLVALGGRVPRRLLAGLAAYAPSVVTSDLLIAMTWGVQSPPTAERSLQSHVARLRHHLDQAQCGIGIEYRAGRYGLVGALSELDRVQFEQRVHKARTDHGPQAIGELRRALGLWRHQTPYSDLLETEYPQAQSAGLVELRVSAHEQLIATLTDNGEHDLAIVEAESLKHLHPYRESVWRLLMVSLYRQGRQADALHAYRDARHVLREGLGVDPSPLLLTVHAHVLGQDPGLLSEPLRSH